MEKQAFSDERQKMVRKLTSPCYERMLFSCVLNSRQIIVKRRKETNFQSRKYEIYLKCGITETRPGNVMLVYSYSALI